MIQNPNATQYTLLGIEITEQGAAFHLGNAKLSIVSDGVPIHAATVTFTIKALAEVLQLLFMAEATIKLKEQNAAPTSKLRQ